MVLEFTFAPARGFRWLYGFYLRKILPRFAGLVVRDTSAYHYLADSIMAYPKPDAFDSLMTRAGLVNVQHFGMTFGTVYLHIGYTPGASPQFPDANVRTASPRLQDPSARQRRRQCGKFQVAQERARALESAEWQLHMAARARSGNFSPRWPRDSLRRGSRSFFFFLIVVVPRGDDPALYEAEEAGGPGISLGRARRLASRRRRMYTRRRVRLPVLVAREPDAADARQTTLLDLGGGVASLRCPWELMRKGDSHRMSFSPGAGRLAAAAHIVRVSGNGTVIHVRFVSLSETARGGARSWRSSAAATLPRTQQTPRRWR